MCRNAAGVTSSEELCRWREWPGKGPEVRKKLSLWSERQEDLHFILPVRRLNLFPRAVLTKDHKLGGLKQQEFVLSQF